MNKVKNWVSAAALVAVAGAAQAALISRSGGMVYDTTLNITWLADWNYAQTSGFVADGRMNWATADHWANTLVYGGFEDWRLPTALNADGSGPCSPGLDCTGSEMGHMFYNNWGAIGNSDFSTGSNAANLALFTHVQSGGYWFGTESAADPNDAWDFYTLDGGQRIDGKSNSGLYAVAVRAGDVAAAVPEPQTLALALLALGAAVAAGRRRAA